jgi:hypothetical protein
MGNVSHAVGKGVSCHLGHPVIYNNLLMKQLPSKYVQMEAQIDFMIFVKNPNHMR